MIERSPYNPSLDAEISPVDLHEIRVDLQKADTNLGSFAVGDARAAVDQQAKPASASRERIIPTWDRIGQRNVWLAYQRRKLAGNQESSRKLTSNQGDFELAG